MYDNKRILGIIPARGGSKGLPRKNVLDIAGKPLIAWTIERAVSSQYLDRIIVSTDDAEIAGIAQQYGAEVPFLRPEELAGDSTPMIDVVSHAVNYFKNENVFFDYVALLEPTSPLRKEDDIDNAVMRLVDNEDDADGLISVGEVHLEHPSIMKCVDGKYLKPYSETSLNVTRRQQLGKVYFPYGVIYLVRTEELIREGTFYVKRIIPYFIERWQNYEVDDTYDFMCIEAVLNHRLEEAYK